MQIACPYHSAYHVEKMQITTTLLTMYACMLTGPTGTKTSSLVYSRRVYALASIRTIGLPAATRSQPSPIHPKPLVVLAFFISY